MRITKAVVPAAGRGTRLLPATRAVPKELLPLGRKPAIQYVMEELAAAGLRQVLLISGPGKRAIQGYFEGGGEPELQFAHVQQDEPRGLADAVALAEPFVGTEPFVVALGDSFIVSQEAESVLSRMLAAHAARCPAATIAVEAVPQEAVSRYGVVAPKEPVEEAFRDSRHHRETEGGRGAEQPGCCRPLPSRSHHLRRHPPHQTRPWRRTLDHRRAAHSAPGGPRSHLRPPNRPRTPPRRRQFRELLSRLPRSGVQ